MERQNRAICGICTEIHAARTLQTNDWQTISYEYSENSSSLFIHFITLIFVIAVIVSVALVFVFQNHEYRNRTEFRPILQKL